MSATHPRLFVTDLDGTLLDERGVVGDDTLWALETAGGLGTVRVVATGRSELSARAALPNPLPIDFLVYSSGAGIVRLCDGACLLRRDMELSQVRLAASHFLDHGVPFSIHAPVPDSHRFAYHGAEGSADLQRRIQRYLDHCWPLAIEAGRPVWSGAASHLLAMPGDGDPARQHSSLCADLPGLKVIRTTSPLSPRGLWLEVFPPGVDKASACAWLAAYLGIALRDCYAVGNDFNDAELLSWAPQACVVRNAPEELRGRYATVASHNDNGVADALRTFGLVD